MPEPREFAIAVETNGDHTTLAVTGEVDLDTAGRLQHQLVQLAATDASLVTVDLANTDFMDSTGLHVLVVAMKRLREKGGDLVVRAPSRKIARVLELSGLTSVIKVV